MKCILYTKFWRAYQEFNLFGKHQNLLGKNQKCLRPHFNSLKNINKEVFEGKKQSCIATCLQVC